MNNDRVGGGHAMKMHMNTRVSIGACTMNNDRVGGGTP